MEIKVQVIIRNKTGQEQHHLLGTFERQGFEPENVGLNLCEAKALLENLQQAIVFAQTKEVLKDQRCCPDCTKPRVLKDNSTFTYRTLFGNIELTSPRYKACNCQTKKEVGELVKKKTVSPLRDLLTEKVSPELLFLESKWASLIPFGKTAELLKDILPLAETHSDNTVRNHLHKVAKKHEARLVEPKGPYVKGCPRDWGELPIPDGPMIVGIDGGFVRSKKKGKFFEVIAGKSMLSFKRGEVDLEFDSRCFALVQTFDTKHQLRLFDHLEAHGMQANQEITFLSDGGETVRNLQLYIYPEADHVLDWFHVAMRFTVLKQYVKGLSAEASKLIEDKEKALKELESCKHYLWHGNVEEALDKTERLWFFLNEEEAKEEKGLKKLHNGLDDLIRYLDNNQAFIVNYGERYRNNETITTAFVESAVNQVISKRFVKKQQMQWSKEGAHLLLQVRTKVLDDELEDVFKGWYPNFQTDSAPELKLAA